MNCSEVRTLLGPYLDGELPEDAGAVVCAHIEQCSACAEARRREKELLGGLRQADPAAEASVPPPLWPAIASRLENGAAVASPRGGIHRLFRRPLALAASVAFLVGVGAFAGFLLTGGSEAAHAVTIDYSVLLDGLTEDLDAAISRFLAYYQAEPVPREVAEKAAPALSFGIPPELPGGFALDQAYRLRFDDAPGVAAIYRRAGDPLIVFFHPIVRDEELGEHEELPCIVGEHHGHAIEVGDWRLMHFMGPSTCHCVLVRRDWQPHLPAIVTLIAPDLAHGSHHAH